MSIIGRKFTITSLYSSPQRPKKSHFDKKCPFFCHQFKKLTYLCTRSDAQMAESVDALVSNTNGVTPVTQKVSALFLFLTKTLLKHFTIFYLFIYDDFAKRELKKLEQLCYSF